MPSMMKLKKRTLYNIFVALIMLSVCFSLSAKDFVVVIDAGHGGHDHGAIDNGVREKSVNLGVALKLGDMIKTQLKDVKVVYTRDDDTFLSLQARANVANKAHGDLFISIHTNSVDKKNRNRKKITGASTYTLGLHKTDENLAVAKRENSVMVLEEDYTTTYQGFDPNSTESYIMFELNQNKHMEQSVAFAQLVQNRMIKDAGRADKGVRQAGFWVLAATSMPAVLVELDFICNPDAAEFLGSGNGQTKFAKAIFNAFRQYKDAYDKQLAATRIDVRVEDNSDTKKVSDSGNAVQEKAQNDKSKDLTVAEREIADADSDNVRFRVQFLTSPKEIEKGSELFKGLYPIASYRDGDIYKYTYGNYKTWEDAAKSLKKVKSKFADAFIIKMKNGKRIK